MYTFVFDALLYILGINNIVVDISSFSSAMLEIAKSTIEDMVATDIYLYLSAIGVALLIIYFMVDLLAQSNREMLTFENLVLAFSKLFVAFAFIMYVSDLTILICDGGSALFDDVSQSIENENTTSSEYIAKLKIERAIGWSNTTNTYNFEFQRGQKYNTNVSDGATTMLDLLQDGDVLGNGIIDYISNFQVIIVSLIIAILQLVIKLACFYVILSNAFQFVMYGTLMPIGISHMMTDGERSKGVIYCKKFFSKALTFTLILVSIYIFNRIHMTIIQHIYGTQDPLIGNYNGAISFDEDSAANTLTININATHGNVNDSIRLRDLFSVKIVAYSLTPNVALLVSLMGINHLSEELLG